jgi:MFS family permease
MNRRSAGEDGAGTKRSSAPIWRWLRRFFVDITPLRRSHDLRALVATQTISVLGSQMTAVAIFYQVYELAHSSLVVGLVSLAMLMPMLIGALFGGSLADFVDRRRLLVIASMASAVTSVGLALNATGTPVLWPLFLCPTVGAGLGTFIDSTLGAVVPNLVDRSEIPAANSTFQGVFQLGLVVGPAVAGLVVALAGVRLVFVIDAVSFGVAALGARAIRPQPPVARGDARPGLRSIMEGVRFLRGRQSVQGALLIDANATVLGMPRALFPALAAGTFGGGATTLGLLYAAPGAGALCGALTSGWVGGISRQGRAVTLAVVVWGLAIAGFGWTGWLPAALVLLALAGYADVISSVLRSTIVQLAVPDRLRGRLSGLHTALVTGAPRLGDFEAGAVAAGFGDTVSVVSGGLACIAGALAIARLLPEFNRLRAAPTAPGRAGQIAANEVIEEWER